MKTLALIFILVLVASAAARNLHPTVQLTPEQREEVRRIIADSEANWSDRYGFMRLTPDPTKNAPSDNENPVLFTSEYYYLLWRLGMLEGEFARRSLVKVQRMIALLRLEPGLFNRRPGREPQAFHRHLSRDEQIGLVTLDRVFAGQPGFARELYDYGQEHRFFYQNRTWSAPGRHDRPAVGRHSSWLALKATAYRQPEFVEYLRLAVGQATSWRQKLVRAGLLLTMSKSRQETSDKILAYLRCEVFYGKDDQTDQVIADFMRKMTIIYGRNPLYGIMCVYYPRRPGLPEHPLRRLAKLLKSPGGYKSAAAPQSTPTPSTITVPLAVSLAEIENYANHQIADQIFFCSGRPIADRTTLQLYIRKNGRIKVHGAADRLKLAIPLRFTARVDWATSVKVFGGRIWIKHHAQTAGALSVNLDIGLAIANDWLIKLPGAISFTWQEKPYIEIGPVRIRISGIAGKQIHHQLNRLQNSLVKKIGKKLRLRQRAEKLWAESHRPVALADDPPLWLLPTPIAVYVSQLHCDHHQLQIELGWHGRLQVILGQKPQPQPISSLPKLKFNLPPRGCHLYLPITLPYSDLSQVVSQELRKRRQELNRSAPISIDIFDAVVYGIDDTLVAAVEVKLGNVRSAAYLSGRPQLQAANMLQIKEFRLDQTFDNVLASGTAEVLKNLLAPQFQSTLEIPLTAELNRTRDRLNSQLAACPLGDHLVVSGKIAAIELITIVVAGEALQVVVNARGNLQARFQGF